MAFLLNKTLGIINTTVENGLVFLLKNTNTFTEINTFKGGIKVDNIDSINGNTTFNSEIIVNSNITANNIHDVDTIFSNTLNINNISLQSGTPYITVKDDIRFNKTITVNGDLIVDGISTTINSQTLTIDDRFITLNANLSISGLSYTDPAGIIVDTHNTTEHSRGYLLWTLFDPNDPTNTELNRTWDLSGDNLRGNVLKATTLRGNILDSYYSPNISVISDIDMNNHDISNINTLTAKNLNIDTIQTSEYISATKYITSNNNYFNIGSNLSKYFKVMTISTNELGFNVADLSQNQTSVNSIFSNSNFFTLSHPIGTDTGHWTTGIDLNILSSGYNGIMQDYQNFKFAVSYKVTDDSVNEWNNKYSNTFPNHNLTSFSFQGQDPQTIYITNFKTWDINFYFIGRWRRKLDSDENPVNENINEFDIAIFNSPTNVGNYQTNVRYVLDMTISKPSEYTTITI